VSWCEETPAVSLRLFDELGVTPRDSVLDIGGGSSRLVEHPLERGHREVAVLDVSTVALHEARRRLGDPGGGVDRRSPARMSSDVMREPRSSWLGDKFRAVWSQDLAARPAWRTRPRSA
jgi:hypothetical protein